MSDSSDSDTKPPMAKKIKVGSIKDEGSVAGVEKEEVKLNINGNGSLISDAAIKSETYDDEDDINDNEALRRIKKEDTSMLSSELYLKLNRQMTNCNENILFNRNVPLSGYNRQVCARFRF
jgi:hypothetical protein